MTFFSRTFIGILYGPSYFAAAPILAVHIWAAVFVFLGVGQNSWTINEGLTKLALWRTIVGAGMNILLNLILIPRYGGLGAAYATVVSYAAAAVFMNASDRRTRGIFRRQIDALFLKDYLSRNG